MAKALGALLIWLLTEAFGWLPARAALTLLFFVFADTALGFGIAVWTKQVESGRMRRGLLKLVLYWAILLVVKLLANAVQWGDFGVMLVTYTISYLLITEAVSVLEKLAIISATSGVQLPIVTVLIDRLKVKRDA